MFGKEFAIDCIPALSVMRLVFQTTTQNLSSTLAKQDPLSLIVLKKEKNILLGNKLAFWVLLGQMPLKFCLGTEKQASVLLRRESKCRTCKNQYWLALKLFNAQCRSRSWSEPFSSFIFFALFCRMNMSLAFYLLIKVKERRHQGMKPWHEIGQLGPVQLILSFLLDRLL